MFEPVTTTAATTHGHHHLSKMEKRRSLQENVGGAGTTAVVVAAHQYQLNQLVSDKKQKAKKKIAEATDENVELNSQVKRPTTVCDYRSERLSRKEIDARMRAENFLTSLPRNELKHYAEIAAILEERNYFDENEDLNQQQPSRYCWMDQQEQKYDAAALKKQVSRALTQQKKVSFHDLHALTVDQQQQQQCVHLASNFNGNMQRPATGNGKQRFSTPPNSPNLSTGHSNHGVKPTTTVLTPLCAGAGAASATITNALTAFRNIRQEESEKRKPDSNRFKRLQIQWELMSKDSGMLKELARAQETKSGGSTPISLARGGGAGAITTNQRGQQPPYVSHSAQKSRIPRPVSYPSGR